MTDDNLIDVPEETARMALLLGLLAVAEDGVLELTPDGKKVIHDFCDRVIQSRA